MGAEDEAVRNITILPSYASDNNRFHPKCLSVPLFKGLRGFKTFLTLFAIADVCSEHLPEGYTFFTRKPVGVSRERLKRVERAPSLVSSRADYRPIIVCPAVNWQSRYDRDGKQRAIIVSF